MDNLSKDIENIYENYEWFKSRGYEPEELIKLFTHSISTPKSDKGLRSTYLNEALSLTFAIIEAKYKEKDNMLDEIKKVLSNFLGE